MERTTDESYSSWSSLQAQNGCMKVNDPYYGKRKTSRTLKRIQRKIQLSNQRKITEEHCNSISNEKEEKTLEIFAEFEEKNLIGFTRSKCENDEAKVQSLDKLKAMSEDEIANLWITKNEILSIFYRCI